MKKRETIERKIFFYRVNAGRSGGKPRPVDLSGCLASVNGLVDDDWYLPDEEGNATCCWVDTVGTRSRLRVARLRRSGLPQMQQKRNLSDLNIPADAGLSEPMHVVVFPGGIAGAEFNFHAPRISRLQAYLRAKTHCKEVAFEPLLRGDVMEQLDQLAQIRVLQLEVTREYTRVVQQASHDLGSALNSALEATGGQHIDIVVRPTKYAREFLSDDVVGLVKRLARRKDLRENAGRFVVRGLNSETDQMETVDILRDLLIATTRVTAIEGRSRGVVRDEMYAAIEEAYESLKDQLEAAASVS